MGYNFKIQSIPGGFGGALYDAARGDVQFSRQVERERLRLADEAAQREAARDALNADLARLQLAGEEARAESAARKEAFARSMQVAELDLQNRRLALDAGKARADAFLGERRLGMDAASLSLSARREDRVAANETERLAQTAAQEQLKLLEMGARPVGRGAAPEGGILYTDGRGRAWSIPEGSGQELKHLVPFLRDNIAVADKELDRRLKDREDLAERLEKLRVERDNNAKSIARMKQGSDRRKQAEAAQAELERSIAAMEKEREALGDRDELLRRRDGYRDVWARAIGADSLSPLQPDDGTASALGQATAPATSGQDFSGPFGALEREIYEKAEPDLSALPQGVVPPDFSALPDEMRRQSVAEWNGRAAQVSQAQREVGTYTKEAARASKAVAAARNGVERQTAERVRDAAIQRQMAAAMQYAALKEQWELYAVQMAAVANHLAAQNKTRKGTK